MSIKKAIIRAQVNDLGLYSKAEDVAEKMRQTKGGGEDFERYFIKQGVKAEELEALGLNDLFRQERVTQQEILDRIDSNRIEMEENVSTGPAEGSYDFQYDEEDLDIEEAYGSGYVADRAQDLLDDMFDAFLIGSIEDYARRYSNDQDEFLELVALMESVVNGKTDFDKLPREIRNDLKDEAESEVILEYERDPIRRITVQVTDENAETQNIGDMRGAAFSYSLVGNEDMGFALDGRERNNVPDNILRQIDNANIYDPDEVVVQLRGIAEEYGDIEGLAKGETRWGEYTLDGGENYQEARLSLPSKGKKRFREGVHFPDDINNVFHIRTKDRKGPMGEKILYVEEVQSDWAQQGRKQGFRSPEVEKQAQEAARQLLEEAGPLLDELTLNDNVRNRPAEGAGFARTLTELLEAGNQARLARINVSSNEFIEADERDKFTEYQRSSALDAAGNIKNALQVSEQRARQAASNILDQEYLDGFTQEQKLEALTNFIIQSRHGVDLPMMELDLIRRNIRSEVEQTLEEKPGRVDQMLLNEARKRGELPKDAYNDMSGLQFDGTNPKFEAALVQAKKEQRDYLAGLGVDPMLYSKLQSALDKADPEGAKLKAEQMQRGKADVAPFVLDTQSWNKLAIKYIFKKAVEEGYDGVSFAPADAHIDRWGEEGLRVQYDENIPRAIDKVFGKAPIIPSNRPETMEVDGYESQIYHLDNLTRDGDSIYEKMKDPTTMFGFAPLPLVLPQGIAGLQGLSPTQAEEQERKVRELERTFPDSMPSESAGILGALKGAGEVAYEGLSDLVIEPFMGMSGAEAAFEMGATPEQAEAARRRAAAMVDFETSSPTGKRYKETVKGGLGALGEYLMGEGEMGRTRSGMPLGPSRDPAQFLFQEALVPAAEAVTEGALGIIGLDPRDTAEMERVRQEAARPFIEAIQPI